MIGTSIWDYIFIQTCIFFLHLVAPFSTAYSLARSLIPPPFHIPRILEVWFALEAMFYLFFYLPRRVRLQRYTTCPPSVCRDDRRILFRRCCNNIPDPDRFLMKWFLDAPASEIKRDNIKEFFQWAFLNMKEPDPAYDEELEEYIGEMEKLLGRKLEHGRGKAKCLRLAYDRIEMLHRSLTWYLVSLCRKLRANLFVVLNYKASHVADNAL